VWEPSSFAAPIAARLHGVADARVTLCPDIQGAAYTLRSSIDSPEITALFGRFGLSPDDNWSRWTVDQCPPRLRLPGHGDRLAMRHIPYAGARQVPAWLLDEPERPRVCITWGFTTQLLGGDGVGLPDLLEAVADIDAEFVVPGGESVPGLAAHAGRNVRLEGYVPLSTLLPTCSAAVHHGGGGTVLTAASYGLPQLMFPQIIDQGLYAHQLGRAGGGLIVPRGEADAATIEAAVEELLADGAHWQGAESLREENAAQPLPAEVVHSLEELVRAG
jgi:UDP:flavonoid glycosyltransferase YjiC (YdhE family)